MYNADPRQLFLSPPNLSKYPIVMAWFEREDHDPINVEDEVSVGLITPKSESAMRHSGKGRHPCIPKSPLTIALILSNIAWAGLCLMLWRGLHLSQKPAPANREALEADFGISSSTPDRASSESFE